MSRTLPNGAVLQALSCIAMLTVSACVGLLYDDTCGAEFRSVESSARILTAQGDTIGYVTLHLEESKDMGRNVSWLIVGESLRGQLDAARLVTSEDTARILFPLSGGPAEPDIIVDGQLNPYTGPVDYNWLFNRARVGALTVVLETRLPNRPIIALPMQVDLFLDWGKAHCS